MCTLELPTAVLQIIAAHKQQENLLIFLNLSFLLAQWEYDIHLLYASPGGESMGSVTELILALSETVIMHQRVFIVRKIRDCFHYIS